MDVKTKYARFTMYTFCITNKICIFMHFYS